MLDHWQRIDLSEFLNSVSASLAAEPVTLTLMRLGDGRRAVALCYDRIAFFIAFCEQRSVHQAADYQRNQL